MYGRRLCSGARWLRGKGQRHHQCHQRLGVRQVALAGWWLKLATLESLRSVCTLNLQLLHVPLPPSQQCPQLQSAVPLSLHILDKLLQPITVKLFCATQHSQSFAQACLQLAIAVVLLEVHCIAVRLQCCEASRVSTGLLALSKLAQKLCFSTL